MPFASVYPLVTARAVAREFTYEVDEGVGVGAIVRMPFGRSRARGIVVSLHDAAPPGVDARPIESVLGRDPADARRARALDRRLLRLDAGARTRARRARVAEAPQGAGAARRAAVARRRGRAAAAVGAAARRRRPDRRRRSTPARGTSCSTARPARARPRSTCRRAPPRSSAGSARSCSCRRSRSRRRPSAAFRQRFGERVAILHSALTDAERRDERARIASGEARIVVGARSAIFAPVRGLGLIVVDEEHDASYKQDSDPRYDARTVAAKRASLEGAVAVYGSATPRPESWAALERLELGGRIGAELPPVRVDRPAARGGLSALGAAPRRAARRRRAPRQGDPAAEPPRDRARAALPRVRHDDPLPELRRRARAARRLGAALPPLRPRRAGAVELPRLRVARSRAPRRRDAEARTRARARAARARADPARRGRGREARAAGRLAAALPRRRGRRAARHADGREGAPLLGHRARRGDRRRHRARRCPTSAPRSARSS